MAGANIPTGNVFDNLPDVLTEDILMQCSPTDRINAAATCQALWRVYDECRKQLTSQSITINGSSDGGVLLRPHNIGKLHINLEMHDCAGYDDSQIYRKLQSLIERIKRDGVQHLSNVHALRIDVCLTYDIRQKCIQLLTQLFPNLISVWFDHYDGVELLSQLDLPSKPGICKLSLTVVEDWMSVSRLPALLPKLHTLRLSVHGPLPNKWWQTLSLVSQLQCLSLTLYEEQNNLSDLLHLTTLRHLKLESSSAIDMRSISSLQQLESVCLCDVQVSYPEAAAQLEVTSLTLQSVRLSQPQAQLLSGMAQQQHSAGPRWSKLTRVQLAGTVSEKLLQAMLLPHPAAANLKVKLSFDTSDDFECFSKQLYKEHFKNVVLYLRDTAPILGPEYLAAARMNLGKVHRPRLHRRLDESRGTKLTDGCPARSASYHVDHDTGRGIKTRDKSSSCEAITLLYQYGKYCVSGAAMILALILFFACWLMVWFKLVVNQLVATN